MNTIFLVRHLPTACNLQRVLQGNRDTPILAPDPPQAGTGVQLPPGRFDLVLCSPLRRALESAAVFGFPAPEVEVLLKEIDFGAYEGRSRDDLMAPETGWVQDPFSSELGPQVHDLRARVEGFFAKYRGRGRVLAFTHGTWMRLAHALYHLDDPGRMNRFMLENGAVLQFDGD